MVVDQLERKKLNTALLESVNIMAENGLDDWRIRLNNKRTSLAETHYRDKSIVYSKHFLLVADKDQLVGVTLHEVAHALLGKGHGHDKAFVELCTQISPNADYAKRSVDVPIRKYLLECPKCGQTGSTNVNKDRYCGVCWRDRKETVIFDRKENLLKVNLW